MLATKQAALYFVWTVEELVSTDFLIDY